MLLKQDCRHFRGDRPCSPHKRYGVTCDGCTYYEPVSRRILIIKLDAVGDVLRTTAILPGIKEKYPDSEITWLTLPASAELFEHNPYVDSLLFADAPGTLPILAVEHYSLLLSLDAAPRSASLASRCNADEKLGFGLSPAGRVLCFNDEAEVWFAMGTFDDVKKANTRTYQELMLGICRLTTTTFEIVLNLSREERTMADAFRRHYGIAPESRVIGLNTGASPRWEQKKWTIEGYHELIKKILNETDFTVVLYGGAYERERNRQLSKGHNRVIMADTEQNLRTFFALLNVSDVVVTGDTLALHAATALGKRVIALFGPTSAAEIETYGRVRKVTSDILECKCYYRPQCTEQVNCMNTISAERVFALVREEIKSLSREESGFGRRRSPVSGTIPSVL